eukprot:GGOE01062102.1.p1 GENE.GGOE01062102.1~~GGOE01062102.1.p1  ORF type:complete len:622 (+),score=146.86 GGOE01062102.1:73-1938(+)
MEEEGASDGKVPHKLAQQLAREKAAEEARLQREKFEQQKKDLEAKMQAALEQQMKNRMEKKEKVKERSITDKLVPAKRPSSEVLEDALHKTGNKKIDTKAAKALVKKQKEEIFNTMGIVGFGKEGKDLGLPAGSRLQAPNWAEEVLPRFEKAFYQELPEVSSRDPVPFRASKEITVWEGAHAPNPVLTFDEAGFPVSVRQIFDVAGMTEPTPIQSQAWPVILSGYDMVGLAETGSGKTLAFLLPAFVHILAQDELKGDDGPIALVVCPTRELAVQIQTQADKFGAGVGVLNACLYGGVDKAPQKRQLQRGSALCIACPGRLLDFLEAGTTNLKRVTHLILDEADRMMDMGFDKQVRKILELIRPDRQTLMFSATWPTQVRRLAGDFLRRAITVQIGNLSSANQNITQTVICISEDGKKNRLFQLLQTIVDKEEEVPRTIIFCLTKVRCEFLWSAFQRKEGWASQTIHGDKTQKERDWVMSEFRNGNCPVLIATDVAARGLDIKDVKYVINYDMPMQLDEYVHRIGRTGRAGELGQAYTFVSSENLHHVAGLIKILEESRQEVPAELRQLAEGRGKLPGSRAPMGKGGYGMKGGKGSPAPPYAAPHGQGRSHGYVGHSAPYT